MLDRLLGRALCAALLVVSLSWAMVACGGDSTSGGESSSSGAATTTTGATTAAASAECADLTALEDSLAALADVDVKRDGVEALTTAIAQVGTDLSTAKTSVSAALEPQVRAVASAFDTLRTAVSGLTTDNLVDKAPSIKSAMKGFSAATTDLVTAITQSCPQD